MKKNHYGEKLTEFICDNMPDQRSIILKDLLQKAYEANFDIRDYSHSIIISNREAVKKECVILIDLPKNKKNKIITVSYHLDGAIADEGSKEITYIPSFFNFNFVIEPEDIFPTIKSILLDDFNIYKKLPEIPVFVPYIIKNKWDVCSEERILCLLSEAEYYLNEYYKKAKQKISEWITQEKIGRPALR